MYTYIILNNAYICCKFIIRSDANAKIIIQDLGSAFCIISLRLSVAGINEYFYVYSFIIIGLCVDTRRLMINK